MTPADRRGPADLVDLVDSVASGGFDGTVTVPPPVAATPADGYPSLLKGYYVLAVLVFGYILSFIDRVVITMLIDPIRASLGISDFQISLLYGFAFSACYTLVGVPMGRLADRTNRRNLIVLGVAVWSTATAVTGMARSYGAMFAARIGVGVGEATLTPSAHSLLSDYFPPARRARALGIYTSALYVGAAIGTFVAGAMIAAIPPVTLPVLGPREPWEVIFLILGTLGIPACLIVMTIPEPLRQGHAAGQLAGQAIPFCEVLAYIWDRRGAYLNVTAGLAILAVLVNGFKAWVPTFLMRTFGWSPADVGLYLGIALLLFGTTGVVFGGWLSDRLRRGGHTDANVRVGLYAAGLILPFGLTAPLMPSGGLMLTLYCAVLFFGAMPFGAAVAAMLAISPNRIRGQVSSLFLLGVNFIGLGGGPVIVGFLSDMSQHGADQLRYALCGITLVAAPVAILCIWLGLRRYRELIAQAEY